MDDRVIKVLADPPAVALAVAEMFLESAKEAIERQGRFTVALSGGSTPRALYELLATDGFIGRVDWAKVQVFFADERCVPPEDPQSNYGMVRDILLRHLPMPEGNVHRMKGEIDPQAAAIEYGRLLKRMFGEEGLDLVLLGMGDDGHTASLFPHTAALTEDHHRCVANYVEKLKAWRLTMTAMFINRSREVAVLVTGQNKAITLRRVLEEASDPQTFPVRLIQPNHGRVHWMLDAAAAGMTGEQGSI